MSETACRGCGHKGLEVVFSLGKMPLANRFLSPNQLEEPEPTYPLDLAFCQECCLVQITESIDPQEMFEDYAYFSSYSSTMVAHAEKLVSGLVEQRSLGPANLALEVASNDGYLLQHYLKAGVPVLGIDPARNVIEAAKQRGVPTRCAFFGPDLAEELRSSGVRADVLHANNVMAHVPDLDGFVRGIARVLSDDGVAVIETPYLRELVEKIEFDTIYHEHLFYYSLSSVDRIFRRNNLTIVDIERIPIHGGSLRIFASPNGQSVAPAVIELMAEEDRLGVCSPGYYRGFAARVEDLGSRLKSLLDKLKTDGSRIAAYGAAAKGTVLLNTLGIGGDTLDYVADRSTYKQGRYIPGVRIPIVPPERLLDDMPDYVLLLTWNFADEILREQEEYRRRGGRFIISIPSPKVM